MKRDPRREPSEPPDARREPDDDIVSIREQIRQAASEILPAARKLRDASREQVDAAEGLARVARDSRTRIRAAKDPTRSGDLTARFAKLR